MEQPKDPFEEGIDGEESNTAADNSGILPGQEPAGTGEAGVYNPSPADYTGANDVAQQYYEEHGHEIELIEWRSKKMNVKKLWQVPVTSSEIVDGGVKLFLQENVIHMLFEYYDESSNVLKAGILFEAVEAQRYTSEMFTEYLPGTYDCLVEVTDSKWVEQLRKLNQEVADYWKFRHYAIFIKSYGFYEFIARNYKIIEK